jgi:hypothetical protein
MVLVVGVCGTWYTHVIASDLDFRTCWLACGQSQKYQKSFILHPASVTSASVTSVDVKGPAPQLNVRNVWTACGDFCGAENAGGECGVWSAECIL